MTTMFLKLSEYVSDDGHRKATVVRNEDTLGFETHTEEFDGVEWWWDQQKFPTESRAEDYAEDFVLGVA